MDGPAAMVEHAARRIPDPPVAVTITPTRG